MREGWRRGRRRRGGGGGGKHVPEIVPILISSTSTRVSRVMVGPSEAMPFPMFSLTSSYIKYNIPTVIECRGGFIWSS